MDYDSITGNGCKQDDTQGFYTVGNNLSGWTTGTSGGFSGYGCSGRYDSMPLTNSNTHTDNRYQVWWFQTSAISSGRCQTWIFIPRTADSADTASTAYFAVLPHKDSWSSINNFTINEANARGSWAFAGTFTMTSGKLAIKLTDKGYGRASAAAALVKCMRS